MNETDKRRLHRAAVQCESAEMEVLEMIGLAQESIRHHQDEMAPQEMLALKEVQANLRAACMRMWSLGCE